MITTIETRWFQMGACPAAVRAWFEALPGDAWPETRTDHYLRLHEPAAVGVKVRAGTKVEIKQRRHDFGARWLAPNVCGRVATWTKSSFVLVPAEPGEGDHERASAEWIAVEKSRWSHEYHLLPDGSIFPLHDLAAGNSCTVEMAELVVETQHWWSIALEAAGPEDGLHVTFDAVAARALAEWPQDIPLTEDCCHPYPQWLRVATPS